MNPNIEIIISGPNGERRVFEGEEFILGPEEKVLRSSKQDIVKSDGTGLGDIIEILAKPIAIILGKQHCSGCAARKTILNIWRQLGSKNVAELLKMTATHTSEEVATEIQRRLDNVATK